QGLRTRWKRTKRPHLGDLAASRGACPQSDLVPGSEASPGNLAVRSRRHERLVRDKCLQQWYKDADAPAQEGCQMHRALTLIAVAAAALALGTVPATAATQHQLVGIEVNSSPGEVHRHAPRSGGDLECDDPAQPA